MTRWITAGMVLAFTGLAWGQAGAFHPPERLLADGKPIDIGSLGTVAHAGPTMVDLDGDGDRDLVVGDFPGYFWRFENIGTKEEAKFTAPTRLQAGGADAKTPVY